MITLNLADLPAGMGIEFLGWIAEHKIGNWESLLEFIAFDPTWYKKEHIPFECSDKEATIILLRWS